MTYDTYDLIAATDAHLTRDKFYQQSGSSGNFRPSEASVRVVDEHGDERTEGGCLRASYFRLSDEYERAKNSARSEFIFMQGKSIERDFINTWKEMGIWVDSNVKYYDHENNISGELDTILKEPDGTPYIVECKSCYGYMAKKEIIGNWKNSGFPKMSHLLQTLVYLNYWHTRGLNKARIVYLFRDSVDRRTFLIELHKEGDLIYPKVEGLVIRSFTVNDIISRYKFLSTCLKAEIVPERDYDLQYPDEKIEDFFKKGKIGKTKYDKWKKGKLGKHEYIGDWNCGYCSYKSICYGVDPIEDIDESEDAGDQ